MNPNVNLDTQQTESSQQTAVVQPVDALPTNTPVQTTVATVSTQPKSRIIIIGIIIAVITIGFGAAAYVWRDTEANRQKQIDTARIEELESENSAMKKAFSANASGLMDVERKNNLSRFATAVVIYQSSNRGALPSTASDWDGFMDNYLKAAGDTFNDPSGGEYVLNLKGELPAEFNASHPVIAVTTGAMCDGDGVLTGQGTRKAAFQMRLSSGEVYCLNN